MERCGPCRTTRKPCPDRIDLEAKLASSPDEDKPPRIGAANYDRLLAKACLTPLEPYAASK
jgi:hypothetical protein